MYPFSTHRGMDARMQLHTIMRLQDPSNVVGPYLQIPTPTERYSTIDTFDSSACEYRIQRQNQTHQKLVSMKTEVQDHLQAPRNSIAQCIEFPMTEYNYPTLNFLFNNSNPSLTANDNGILREEYEQRSTTGKQMNSEKLNPFYRRHNLAPFGDGITRTRDKYRVVYTEKQKKLLEDEYDQTRFLPDARRVALAQKTELSERQIKFWFQNRRAKDKRNRKASKKEKNCSKAASDQRTFRKDIETVESISKKITKMEEIKASCKNTSQKCSSKQIALTTNGGRVENKHQPSTYLDTVSPQFTSSCKYSKLHTSISPSSGSCRFVNEAGCSVKKTFSNTGSQYLNQYPVSPSEWTLANQRSYFVNSMALSPLLNGLQYGFDCRL